MKQAGRVHRRNHRQVCVTLSDRTVRRLKERARLAPPGRDTLSAQVGVVTDEADGAAHTLRGLLAGDVGVVIASAQILLARLRHPDDQARLQQIVRAAERARLKLFPAAPGGDP